MALNAQNRTVTVTRFVETYRGGALLLVVILGFAFRIHGIDRQVLSGVNDVDALPFPGNTALRENTALRVASPESESE